MGIRERKQKHKEDLRQTILDAAKKLFLNHGYHATSIRKIANEIEFSPTTLYLYYKDKAEIAHALHIEGFKLLGQQLNVARLVSDPMERLKLMGRIYITFSLENTDFYELMFVLKEPMEHIKENHTNDNDECWQEGEQAFNMLIDIVVTCQQAGYFSGYDPYPFALMLWSTLHGLCTLNLHGHLGFIKTNKKGLEHIEDIFETTYNTFINILEKQK